MFYIVFEECILLEMFLASIAKDCIVVVWELVRPALSLRKTVLKRLCILISRSAADTFLLVVCEECCRHVPTCRLMGFAEVLLSIRIDLV